MSARTTPDEILGLTQTPDIANAILSAGDLIGRITLNYVRPNGQQVQVTVSEILRDPALRSALVTGLSRVTPQAAQIIGAHEQRLQREESEERLLAPLIPAVREAIYRGRLYFNYVDSRGVPQLIDVTEGNSIIPNAEDETELAMRILRENKW